VPFFAAVLLDGTALLPDDYAATNSACYVDRFEDCPHGGEALNPKNLSDNGIPADDSTSGRCFSVAGPFQSRVTILRDDVERNARAAAAGMPQHFCVKRKRKRKKANRGPRLTPEGLRPRHPRRGGRNAGNAGQHGKRAATRGGASNGKPDHQQTCVHQQALPHQQQTPQPKGHNRQESSTQQEKQGGDKRTRSRKDPGAMACKSGRHPQGQKSQHAATGARAQPLQRHQSRDPREQSTNQ
jgi:hypothetical protein